VVEPRVTDAQRAGDRGQRWQAQVLECLVIDEHVARHRRERRELQGGQAPVSTTADGRGQRRQRYLAACVRSQTQAAAELAQARRGDRARVAVDRQRSAHRSSAANVSVTSAGASTTTAPPTWRNAGNSSEVIAPRTPSSPWTTSSAVSSTAPDVAIVSAPSTTCAREARRLRTDFRTSPRP